MGDYFPRCLVEALVYRNMIEVQPERNHNSLFESLGGVIPSQWSLVFLQDGPSEEVLDE